MALATRSKPPAHTRKRQGDHHRHTKHYLKSYWPYLPMLLIVGLGLLVNSAWAGAGDVLGSQTGFTSSSLLADTNAARARQGEAALALNEELNAAAQAKAEDMVRSNYWAHTSPAGKTPWAFITASGYQYRNAGENLAYGFTDANQSINGWLNSPEHRANMLNNDYRDVGFGVATSLNFVGQGPQTVVVAEYAQPGTAALSTAPDGKVLSAQATAKPVARIQMLSGSQTWSLLAVIVLSGAAMALFLLRHGYRAHRLITQGEMLVTRHPYLDIFIVFVIVAGGVLTRTGGIIH